MPYPTGMDLRPALLVATVACASSGPAGDLNFVLVPAPGQGVTTAHADVDQLLLEACDGEVVVVEVGRTLDLLFAEPIAVPVGEWCTFGVGFAGAPFDGSLRLDGELDGRASSVALDPGLAARRQPLHLDAGAESVLALDASLLLGADRDEVARAGAVRPDAGLAQDLADRVGPALVWFEAPEDGADVYLDLWPDLDLSVTAEVRASGCGDEPWTTTTQGTLPTAETTGTGSGTPTGPPGAGSTGADGGGDGRGCDGGGGCAGGSGCAGGGGCAAGCDVDACSTTGLAPVGWAALVVGLARRRR